MRIAALFFLMMCSLGCATTRDPFQSLNPPSENVRPVVTPLTSLMECVGDLLVIRRPNKTISFLFKGIGDTTASLSAPDRTLSDGGFDWVRSAVESVKPSVTLLDSGQYTVAQIKELERNGPIIVITGNFTELESQISAKAAKVGGRYRWVDLRVGGDESFGYVALDMAFKGWRDYTAGTAKSVQVAFSNRTGNADIKIDDGKGNGAVASFVAHGVSSAHRAQRIAIEYLTLAIIADIYNVDLRSCSNAAPYVHTVAHSKRIEFKNADSFLRQQRLQIFLLEEGFYFGEVDGLFGAQSRRALNEFLRSKSIPTTDNYPESRTPIATYYTLLALRSDARRRGLQEYLYLSSPPVLHPGISYAKRPAGSLLGEQAINTARRRPEN